MTINKVVTIVIAFLLKFRVVYNIPNRAIVVLLRFIKYLLFVIGQSFGVPQLTNDIYLPQSIQGCYSYLHINSSPYKEYVVCPMCQILYDQELQELVTGSGTSRHSSVCTFVEFPNHPQRRFRQPCNTALMNTVRCGRSHVFRPRKIYYYYGLKLALNTLVKRPNFMNLCNLWLKSRASNDFMADITDGKVWKELVTSISPDRTPVNILGLLINIDWFQPYKDISYSVGVIYAVIINLPRSLRYKEENVIIVGIIPGPHEPKKHINSFLGPLVSELLEFHTGMWLSTSIGWQFLRCVLMCQSSDIPATRKAAGFLGHHANKGCSRCLKSFPKVGDSLDYSGFERHRWPKRTNFIHRQKAYKTLASKTKADRKRIESENGARFCILFELPYYDAIRFTAIDVMHNLFLGTAKNVVHIWKDLNLLCTNDFKTIQQRILLVNVPVDVGRIPYKIDTGMSSMTAEQWKNWTCIYSLYLLHDLLPSEHLNCWWLFVRACIILCKPLISNADIDRADELILEFCKQFESLYGSDRCTMNLHLHCHLAECLRDYGPSHATWCFSFERCNGILGNTPNNKRYLQIEKTMITRFVEQMESPQSLLHLSELNQFFPTTTVGSLSETHTCAESIIKLTQLSTGVNASDLDFTSIDHLIYPLGQMHEHALQSLEVVYLTRMYTEILKDSRVLCVSPLCRRFARIKLYNKMYSSQMARSDRASYVTAHWLSDSNSGIDLHAQCRPGQIQYYIKHNVVVEDPSNGAKSTTSFLLAFVGWYKHHPEKHFLLSPVTLWCPDFVPMNESSFIPVCRIAGRCMQTVSRMDFPERPYNSGNTVIITPIGYTN